MFATWRQALQSSCTQLEASFSSFFLGGGGVARNEEETREEMQESTEQILTGRRCCCVGWTGCGPLMCSGLQRQIMLTNTFHEMKLETKFLK